MKKAITFFALFIFLTTFTGCSKTTKISNVEFIHQQDILSNEEFVQFVSSSGNSEQILKALNEELSSADLTTLLISLHNTLGNCSDILIQKSIESILINYTFTDDELQLLVDLNDYGIDYALFHSKKLTDDQYIYLLDNSEISKVYNLDFPLIVATFNKD